MEAFTMKALSQVWTAWTAWTSGHSNPRSSCLENNRYAVDQLLLHMGLNDRVMRAELRWLQTDLAKKEAEMAEQRKELEGLRVLRNLVVQEHMQAGGQGVLPDSQRPGHSMDSRPPASQAAQSTINNNKSYLSQPEPIRRAASLGGMEGLSPSPCIVLQSQHNPMMVNNTADGSFPSSPELARRDRANLKDLQKLPDAPLLGTSGHQNIRSLDWIPRTSSMAPGFVPSADRASLIGGMTHLLAQLAKFLQQETEEQQKYQEALDIAKEEGWKLECELRSEVESLKKNLLDKQGAAEFLLNSLRTEQERAVALDLNLTRERTVTTDLQERLSTTKEDLQQSLAGKEELQISLEQEKKKADQLSATLEQERSIMSILREALKTEQSHCQDLMSEQKNKQFQTDQLSAALEQERLTNANLWEELVKERSHCEDLISQQESKVSQIEKLSTELEEERASNTDLCEKLEAERCRCDEVISEEHSRLVQIEQLSAELEQENISFYNELEIEHLHCQELESQLEQVSAELSEARTSNTKRCEDLHAEQSHCQDLVSEQRSKDSEIVQLSAALEQKKMSSTNLLEKLHTDQALYQGLVCEDQRKQSQIEKLSAALEQERTSFNKELEMERSRYQALVSEEKDRQNEIHQLSALLQQETSKKDDILEHLKTEQSRCQGLVSEEKNKQSQIDQLSADLRQLRVEVKSRQNMEEESVHRWQQIMTQHQDFIQTLRSTLAKERKRREDLEATIRDEELTSRSSSQFGDEAQMSKENSQMHLQGVIHSLLTQAREQMLCLDRERQQGVRLRAMVQQLQNQAQEQISYLEMERQQGVRLRNELENIKGQLRAMQEIDRQRDERTRPEKDKELSVISELQWEGLGCLAFISKQQSKLSQITEELRASNLLKELKTEPSLCEALQATGVQHLLDTEQGHPTELSEHHRRLERSEKEVVARSERQKQEQQKQMYYQYLQAGNARKPLKHPKKCLLLEQGTSPGLEKALPPLIAQPVTGLRVPAQHLRPLQKFRSAARAVIAVFRMKLLANRWIKITLKGQRLVPAINTAGTEMFLEQQLKQQSAAVYPTSIKDIGGAKGTSPLAGMCETPMHNCHLHNRSCQRQTRSNESHTSTFTGNLTSSLAENVRRLETIQKCIEDLQSELPQVPLMRSDCAPVEERTASHVPFTQGYYN